MTNILLVDDNKFVRDTLALTLTDSLRGCDILTAKNGREALDILDRMPVALVLTDIEMPVMNGFQFIEFKNRLHPSIPLIAMTGDLSPGVGGKLRSLGVERCIEKPFDYDEVMHLIMQNLGTRSVSIPVEENGACCASTTA